MCCILSRSRGKNLVWFVTSNLSVFFLKDYLKGVKVDQTSFKGLVERVWLVVNVMPARHKGR